MILIVIVQCGKNCQSAWRDSVIPIYHISIGIILIKFSTCRGRYPALGHSLLWAIFFFFKWEKNKYFSPYAYCFIFKSDLLNPKFVEKISYFILFFLESYFFDEQSKLLDIRFYWNRKVKHRFIYERKLE